MSYKPIFVVGAPRSGTTLTARILGLHSNIFMPGETHYFNDILSDSKKIGDMRTEEALEKIVGRLYTIYDRYYEEADQRRIEKIFPTRGHLAAALDGCDSYACIFDRFMSLQMDYESKKRWGNNVPRDIFNYRTIREIYPDAKFVVCVRDIRAFLWSYQGKWKVTGQDHVGRLKKLYHPVVTSYLWKSSLRLIERLNNDIPVEDRIIVKYENLVTKPEEVVRDICRTIEEPFESSMLEVTTHNSSDEQQGNGIFSESLNRWKSHLSTEEIAIAQFIAKKEMAYLGYSNVAVSPSLYRVIGIILMTPFKLFLALQANRGTSGPLMPYLASRVSALLGLHRQGK